MHIQSNPEYRALTSLIADHNLLFESGEKNQGRLIAYRHMATDVSGRKLQQDYTPQNNFPLLKDEWENSLHKFSFDASQLSYVEFLRNPPDYSSALSLLDMHAHVYGNTFSSFTINLEKLAYHDEDCKADPDRIEKFKKKQTYIQSAQELVEASLFRISAPQAGFSEFLSCYDKSYISAFYMDVTKNLFASGKLSICNDPDGQINKRCLHQLAEIFENEVKITQAIYDFAEVLAQDIGMPIKGKVAQNTAITL